MSQSGDTPLVGVGIPTYNRPTGLRRMLECVTSQTYPNLDIVVSDNASSQPEVQKIIQEFAEKDGRVRSFRQAENIGFQNNFRFVFEKTRGEFFAWAADDDEWDTRFIEVCLANLREPSKNVVLSFCHVRKRKSDGTIIDSDYSDKINSNGDGVVTRINRYMQNTIGNHCFYGLYRREAINSWFFARRFGYDFLAIMVLLRMGGIHIDKQVLFTSTIGGSGFERQNFHKYYDSRLMKICVNLSSTLTWMFEFFRCIALTPYTTQQKIGLSACVVWRFAQPRFWRRFAGDMLALLSRRDIWKFEAK